MDDARDINTCEVCGSRDIMIDEYKSEEGKNRCYVICNTCGYVGEFSE